MGVRSTSASSKKECLVPKYSPQLSLLQAIQEDAVFILYKDHILLLNDIALCFLLLLDRYYNITALAILGALNHMPRTW
jgi:hypothetical protein